MPPTPVTPPLTPPQAQEEPPPQKEVKDEEGDELWDALESVPTPRKAKKRKISGF